MGVMKRLLIVLGLALVPLILGLLFTYDVIKIDWISFMEIQSSFKPQKDPLPVPAQSIPIQGAAYISALGEPTNPVPADDASVKRGKQNYSNGCLICHGAKGDGKGPFASDLTNKPASLVDEDRKNMSDGEMFMIITNGVKDKMPQLRENFPTAQMRWDIVNYIRSLQKAAK